MKKSKWSYIFVVIQFVSIVYFLVFYHFFVIDITLVFKVLGILLVIWSLLTMNKSVISAFPDPSEKTRIIQEGPYRFIRHPMYLSLFLLFIPMLNQIRDIYGLTIMALFVTNQLFKLFYEERLLKAKFIEYSQYMNNTWRLIPYIF